MKKWLKHTFGYINIDEENFYLTKTGNWSEIIGLKEKNDKPQKPVNFKTKLKIGIYLIFLLTLILFGIIANIRSGNIIVLLIIGLPVLAFIIFQYIIPEFGSSFVIPKKKITKLHASNTSLYI